MFFNESCACMNQQNFCQGPIIEPPIEKCIEKNICHKVEHICPIHTRIINNHVYEHTYRPEYTCSEENIVTNIDPTCGCGCNMF